MLYVFGLWTSSSQESSTIVENTLFTLRKYGYVKVREASLRRIMSKYS
jgi:hypothetical protein